MIIWPRPTWRDPEPKVSRGLVKDLRWLLPRSLCPKCGLPRRDAVADKLGIGLPFINRAALGLGFAWWGSIACCCGEGGGPGGNTVECDKCTGMEAAQDYIVTISGVAAGAAFGFCCTDLWTTLNDTWTVTHQGYDAEDCCYWEWTSDGTCVVTYVAFTICLVGGNVVWKVEFDYDEDTGFRNSGGASHYEWTGSGSTVDCLTTRVLDPNATGVGTCFDMESSTATVTPVT